MSIPETKGPVRGGVMRSKLAKTMKREVAVCGLLFWAVIVGRVVWSVPIKDIEFFIPLLNVITWPVWTYAAAAFGLDALQKREASQVPQYEEMRD